MFVSLSADLVSVFVTYASLVFQTRLNIIVCDFLVEIIVNSACAPWFQRLFKNFHLVVNTSCDVVTLCTLVL